MTLHIHLRTIFRTGIQHRFPLEGPHISAHRRNCDNAQTPQRDKDDIETPNTADEETERPSSKDEFTREKSNAEALAEINKARRRQKAIKAGRKAAMLLGKKEKTVDPVSRFFSDRYSL